MVTIMKRETGRRRGREKQPGSGYLSFSKKDIRDDVRETATQHQHHTLLAVCYTRHLETRGILYFVAVVLGLLFLSVYGKCGPDLCS